VTAGAGHKSNLLEGRAQSCWVRLLIAKCWKSLLEAYLPTHGLLHGYSLVFRVMYDVMVHFGPSCVHQIWLHTMHAKAFHFCLMFRGALELPLNACIYLSGVVHWCASLLLLLPSVGFKGVFANRRAMAVTKSR